MEDIRDGRTENWLVGKHGDRKEVRDCTCLDLSFESGDFPGLESVYDEILYVRRQRLCSLFVLLLGFLVWYGCPTTLLAADFGCALCLLSGLSIPANAWTQILH